MVGNLNHIQVSKKKFQNCNGKLNTAGWVNNWKPLGMYMEYQEEVGFGFAKKLKQETANVVSWHCVTLCDS